MQTWFLMLTISKGKGRKEHDLLRHEAEFITFVTGILSKLNGTQELNQK